MIRSNSQSTIAFSIAHDMGVSQKSQIENITKHSIEHNVDKMVISMSICLSCPVGLQEGQEKQMCRVPTDVLFFSGTLGVFG